MNRKGRINDHLFQPSNSLRILSYFINHPNKAFYPVEIQRATALSRAGVYLALKELTQEKLIIQDQRGRFVSYVAAVSNPIVRQYKILKNLLVLAPVWKRLQDHAQKVILFGSISRGEDYPDSDIDLFILTKDPDGVAGLLQKINIRRKIQPVIKTPSSLAEFTLNNPAFTREIDRGIVLWEASE